MYNSIGKNRSNSNLVLEAIRLNDLGELRRLLNGGADLYFTDAKGNTVLHYAYLFVYTHNDNRIVNYLINEKNFDINKKNHEGRTAEEFANKYILSQSSLIDPLMVFSLGKPEDNSNSKCCILS